MAGFLGGDTAAMQTFADTLARKGTELDELGGTLSTLVQGAAWEGRDGDEFRSRFSAELSAPLTDLSGALTQRSTDLRAQAEEQDQTSSIGTAAPGAGEDPFAGGLADNPLLQTAMTLKDVAMGVVKSWAGFKGARDLHSLWRMANIGDDIAASARTFLQSGMIDDALGFFGTMGKAGRFAGGALGALGVVTGIKDMIAPPHDGWRGVGDRIAGGLSVIGGAGSMAVMLGAGAALGPVGLGVVAVAGAGAALWTAGNAIVDNWDSITATAGDIGGAAQDLAGDVSDAASNAWDGVTSWAGGLF